MNKIYSANGLCFRNNGVPFTVKVNKGEKKKKRFDDFHFVYF